MLFRIFIFSSLLCSAGSLLSQELKPNTSSNIGVTLDSINKEVLQHKKAIFISYRAYYTLKNKSNDTIVFVTNSCPSINKYTLEINDSLYLFNRNVNCSFNAFRFDTIAPSESIHISVLLLTDLDIEFNEDQVLTFSIPIVVGDNGEVHVNGAGKEGYLIHFTGKAKLNIEYSNLKNKKKRQSKAK
ncbi:MAG: hypothetical protein N4A41_05795, partial [Crocinitomicaceae bacterium]|nr:hypothetical protein [Crocinitomicaceae bacterium]